MTVEEMKLAFAKNLKEIMDSSNNTQEDIAKICGVSQQTVSDWLTGKKYPRMDKVQAILDHFNIPMTALVNDGKEPNQEYLFDPETAELAKSIKQRPKIIQLNRRMQKLSDTQLKYIEQFTEFIIGHDKEKSKIDDDI